MSTPILEVVGLQKHFGDLAVLRGIDFSVQTGDVIFEVAGKPVRNYTEFSNAVSEEGTYPIKLVRFTETGYELLESVFDTSLGRLAILGLTDDNRAEAE